MSADYYNCASCGVVVSDYDGDFRVCEHCCNAFCSSKCAKFDEINEDDEDEDLKPKCCICRCDFDDLSDNIAFQTFLEFLGMSHETAIELIRGHMLQDDKEKT